MNYLFLIVIGLFLQGCSVVGIRTVELLEYQTLEKKGNFDIRQYEDYWVARTEIGGEYKTSTNKGFNLLFNYISGKNTQQEKIAMTGPVIQQAKGEKIAMTGPVIQQKQGNRWVMEFVLPAKFKDNRPPDPVDPEVKVVKVSGYKAAALRYSGNLGEEKFAEKSRELFDMLQQKGLQPMGEPFYAGYDPPWTIPFLKRNEVLVIIK